MRNFTLYRTGEPPFRFSGAMIDQAANGSHMLRVFRTADGGFAGHVEWKAGNGWHWSKMFRKADTAAEWFADHQPHDYTFGDDVIRRQIADNYRLLADRIRAAIRADQEGRIGIDRR